MKASNI